MRVREADPPRQRGSPGADGGTTTTPPPSRRGAAAPEETGDSRPVPRLQTPPPEPVPVPRTPFLVLVLVIVAGGVLGILLLNTKVNENTFILHDLRQEQAHLDQRQQELEQQIARADTPAQLEAQARELGLVKAEELAYLRLPDGAMFREPLPAGDQPGRPEEGAPGGPEDGAPEGTEG